MYKVVLYAKEATYLCDSAECFIGDRTRGRFTVFNLFVFVQHCSFIHRFEILEERIILKANFLLQQLVAGNQLIQLIEVNKHCEFSFVIEWRCGARVEK